MPVIEVENVTKIYPTRRGAGSLLGKSGLMGLFGRSRIEKVAALKDISFTVEGGESVGIIGHNGSGKSTLLKLIAGVNAPSSGHVRVSGRVASLLELGAGFHPFLTGRENIYLNAGLLGMRHAQVDEVFDSIVEFSGIAEFIDNPVATYSSGMYVRIGFAVAVHVNPDIFLVDEVLSVGDEEFQRKCRTRIGELREQGKTIVFVSHDLGIVNTLCDRVILLSKGNMIARETPQKTIEFYMRQVGQAEGIHTFSNGQVEVIMSNGRVSLFHNQNEVSAPAGFFLELRSMGQTHDTAMAAWNVREQCQTYCEGRGRMARLPVVVVWQMEFQDGRLLWKIDIECERDVPIQAIELQLSFSTEYETWLYGDMSGSFPTIEPSDVVWTLLVDPDVYADQAAVLPSAESSLPPTLVNLKNNPHNFRLLCLNSEYTTGCRIIQIAARFPDKKSEFSKGRHSLLTVEIDPTISISKMQELLKSKRTLRKDEISARFEQGIVRISCDDIELSSFTHLYSSLLIAHLWNDSSSLQWGQVECDGTILKAVGESRRFPYRQHWVIEVVDEGFALQIWMEALEALDVQEYHAAISVRPEYDRWETDHETGIFPPFTPGDSTWRHFNKSYEVGSFAKALSLDLPSVRIAVAGNEIPFRMTVINSGYEHNARVLQALRVPDHGVLHFEKGRHLLFSGVVSVEKTGDDGDSAAHQGKV